MQELHTSRRDLTEKIERRLCSSQMRDATHAPGWLWADVKSVAEWKKGANIPAGLTGRELTAWAKQQTEQSLQNRLDVLDALLKPGALLTVEAEADEQTGMSVMHYSVRNYSAIISGCGLIF